MTSNSLVLEQTTASHQLQDDSTRDAASTTEPSSFAESLWTPTACGRLQYRPVARDKSRRLSHAVSVALVDQPHVASDRFLAATDELLEVFDSLGTRATFFVLGRVAEEAPQLIHQLHDLGHEVQIHGYDHTEVHRQTPAQFRADLLRCKHLVEDVCQAPVDGFRAPRFSIDARNLWALDVLADCDFRYDSSILPMRLRGCGIAGWPSYGHHLYTLRGTDLVELPVATVRVLGRSIAVGGGGYFRRMPYGLIRHAVRWLESRGRPAVIYCRPHESRQGAGRRDSWRKLSLLLGDFPFGPLRDLLPE